MNFLKWRDILLANLNAMLIIAATLELSCVMGSNTWTKVSDSIVPSLERMMIVTCQGSPPLPKQSVCASLYFIWIHFMAQSWTITTLLSCSWLITFVSASSWFTNRSWWPIHAIISSLAVWMMYFISSFLSSEKVILSDSLSVLSMTEVIPWH